jgi:hypothetical protein
MSTTVVTHGQASDSHHVAVQTGSGPKSESAATAGKKSLTSQAARRVTGYGLPCAKCNTYYAADLSGCPVCSASERVDAPPVQAKVPLRQAEELSKGSSLEQERERFLNDFNNQLRGLIASQVGTRRSCMRKENHPGISEAAAVCKSCYERLEKRLDRLESALQIDLKQAAQIVYDAVWADPSDSSRTYENAAHALLSELRRRSGVFPKLRLQITMD